MLGSELEASIKRDGRKPFQKSRFLRLMLWKSSPDTPLMTEAAALTWFLLSQFISVMGASDLPIGFSKPKSPAKLWIFGLDVLSLPTSAVVTRMMVPLPDRGCPHKKKTRCI